MSEAEQNELIERVTSILSRSQTALERALVSSGDERSVRLRQLFGHLYSLSVNLKDDFGPPLEIEEQNEELAELFAAQLRTNETL